MTLTVEEFYNRVHGKGGRFATSGTGGGHYKGRASGAKRPGGSKAPPPPPARTIKVKGSLGDRLAAVTAKTAVKRRESLRRAETKKYGTATADRLTAVREKTAGKRKESVRRYVDREAIAAYKQRQRKG